MSKHFNMIYCFISNGYLIFSPSDRHIGNSPVTDRWVSACRKGAPLRFPREAVGGCPQALEIPAQKVPSTHPHAPPEPGSKKLEKNLDTEGLDAALALISAIETAPKHKAKLLELRKVRDAIAADRASLASERAAVAAEMEALSKRGAEAGRLMRAAQKELDAGQAARAEAEEGHLEVTRLLEEAAEDRAQAAKLLADRKPGKAA